MRLTRYAAATVLFGLSFTGTLSAQSLCEDQCLESYYQCDLNCLNAGANVPGCSESCQNALDNCIASCPPCPTIRDYSTSTIVSTQLIEAGRCLYSQSNSSNGKTPLKFDRYGLKLRVRNYRETKACNGTISTVLLSDSLVNDSCWRLTSFSCSPGSIPGSYSSSNPRCPF